MAGGRTRIFYNRQRLRRQHLPIGFKLHRVDSRRGARTPRNITFPVVRLVALGYPRASPRKIPDQPMHARRGPERLRLREPALRNGHLRMVRLVPLCGCESPHQLVMLVVNSDRDFVRFAGQIVVEDRAIWRVLRSWLLGRQWSSGESIVIHAHGRLRLVEKSSFAPAPFRRLPQRSYVIQYPERPPVGGDDQIIPMHGQVAY